MRKHITLVLLLLSTLAFGQKTTSHLELNWHTSNQNNSYSNFYFDQAKIMGKTGLVPYYVLEIPLKTNEVINNIKITNSTIESVHIQNDLYNNMQRDMTDSFKILPYYKIINHKRVAIISIPTLKNNLLSSVVDKLISFDLEYEKQINPNYYDQNSNLNGKEFIFANKSAMRNGDWYQFRIKKNGVYKLSYSQISQAGININDIASSNIKMYGFGNMLKEANSELRDADIPEIAIKMEDGGDGSFDSGDYILFYAQGPDNWEYLKEDKRFKHRLNIYSRSAYYYLVLSDGNGKRIEETSSVNNSNFTVSSFADYGVIEDERYNLINSGRRWFGDKYEFTTNYDYKFSFKNISQNSKINLKAVFVARSERSSTFKITAFNETKRINISQIGNGSYPEYANNGSGDWEFNNTSASENIPITVEYSQPLSSSVGWLDFLEINVERDLIFSGSQMEFRDPKSIRLGRISKFKLQNSNGKPLEVWETTNHNTPSKITYITQGNSIEFTLPTNDLREFISFDKSLSLNPEYVKKVENQNLHAELNHEYIIVTYSNFLEQAEELAQFHRDDSGMDVYVTTLAPIYHEYSSGKQDISAIRDFLRSVYLNSDDDKKLKYVLFLGDASMDYLKREENNTNMVPTWESYESLKQIYSIATDDFFAFFDEDEGASLIQDVVDIGTGRFPVVTTAEAQQMVDKVKHYASNKDNVMADWRNVICFIADDEDNNLHLDQANDLSIIVDEIYPTANLDKIFVDAYQQESTSAGQRYPKVNQAINERVDKGALIISYTGHGGEVGWGQERFLDVPDIVSWTNYDKLPVFLTATCEFSRYDDPERVSAGELIFLNHKGGGISLFTTSRATFASSNFIVSKHFYNIALTRKDGKYPRMGEIMKRTKEVSGTGSNILKFILLGDPALRLNMPEYKLNVNSVHNTISGNITDTIKALSSITIKGNITNGNDQILSDFNGLVYPSIYDKPSEVTTLGNDGGSNPYTFELQKNILYKGKADVINGEFEFEFIVPKDISYSYGHGKISLYAENADIDATGFDNEIIIGGYDDNTIIDNNGPQIQLYINNSNFIEGGITNENPILLAYLSDENGINTTGNGIGHDITAILDSDESNIKILNDYYIADVNSYKTGGLSFPFFNLSDGEHYIELKVWDIQNNSSKAKVYFTVASSSQMALENIFNYPNPVTDYTTFSFEHNQSAQNIEVIIDIYNINGSFVTQLTETLYSDGYRNNEIQWNATDASGNLISKGIYVYKINIKSESGKESHKTSKLVVIK